MRAKERSHFAIIDKRMILLGNLEETTIFYKLKKKWISRFTVESERKNVGQNAEIQAKKNFVQLYRFKTKVIGK